MILELENDACEKGEYSFNSFNIFILLDRRLCLMKL